MSKSQVRQISKADMKQYGESFKLMREYAGMTAKELSAEIGVHHTMLLKWEKAANIPNEDIYEIDSRIRFAVKSRILENEYLYKKYQIIHSLCGN